MNKWYVVILVVAVAAFCTWYYRDYYKIKSVEISYTENEITEATTENTEIMVHIAGEVKAPGVYSLKMGDRVIDAINSAGGFTDLANADEVNLAAYVKDAEKIVVNNVNEKVDKAQNSPQNSSGELININTADKEGLMKLSGIGEVLAETIISYRNNEGNFKDIEEIKNVNGIGDKIYEDIKDSIVC